MTDDQRDAFVNMAENLGIEPGDAEDLVDLYLEEIENQAAPSAPKPVIVVAPKAPVASTNGAAAVPLLRCAEDSDADRRRGRTGAVSSILQAAAAQNAPRAIRSFSMGSEAPDAAPNERPITPVTLSCYLPFPSPDHERAIRAI